MTAARARLLACSASAHIPVRSRPMLLTRASPTQVPTKPITAHAALQRIHDRVSAERYSKKVYFHDAASTVAVPLLSQLV